jgi:glycosyltransferase involved in cell wall biosynthesis
MHSALEGLTVLNNKRVVVVMPAYNAGKTLIDTWNEIPFDIVDEVILVDDCSADNTVDLARTLGVHHVIRHDRNIGYGGNQKTCYRTALEHHADIVVMLHPDYQYTPKLIPALAHLLASGLYDVALGSRILGRGARLGGMPLYKYVANRFLTFVQNLLIHEKLSEYHTGFRAYTADVLRTINYQANDDDFIFDNQVISQVFMKGYRIAEVTCPTTYAADSSSINLTRSITYGLGVLNVSMRHFLHAHGIWRWRIYQ